MKCTAEQVTTDIRADVETMKGTAERVTGELKQAIEAQAGQAAQGVEQLRAALMSFQTETNATLRSMQGMIQLQAE